MIVAIHQPNYLPWLGYFAKMAEADAFVFLDNVQFSKGSFTNRVRIAGGPEGRWLTTAIRHEFGATIMQVRMARADWARAHRDILVQTYRSAAYFRDVWPEIEAWFLAAQPEALAEVNERLIRNIASKLGLAPRFYRASDMAIDCEVPDRRLAMITASLAPSGIYLSGSGGANYQHAVEFEAHGIALRYLDYRPPIYTTGAVPHLAGLSILDAVFHNGWAATAALLLARRAYV